MSVPENAQSVLTTTKPIKSKSVNVVGTSYNPNYTPGMTVGVNADPNGHSTVMYKDSNSVGLNKGSYTGSKVFDTTSNTIPVPETTPGSFGDTLTGIGQIGQAAAGLANAYVAYRNYKIAKQQQEFQEKLARANFQHQAQQYNNQLDSYSNVAGALAGSGLAGLNYNGSATSGELANYKGLVNQHKVSETF